MNVSWKYYLGSFSTGSYHHFDQGLHRRIRQMPLVAPMIKPFFSRDSIIYALHEGICLQYGGRSNTFAQNEWSGERYFWYWWIMKMRTFLTMYKSIIFYQSIRSTPSSRNWRISESFSLSEVVIPLIGARYFCRSHSDCFRAEIVDRIISAHEKLVSFWAIFAILHHDWEAHFSSMWIPERNHIFSRTRSMGESS